LYRQKEEQDIVCYVCEMLGHMKFKWSKPKKKPRFKKSLMSTWEYIDLGPDFNVDKHAKLCLIVDINEEDTLNLFLFFAYHLMMKMRWFLLWESFQHLQ